MNEDVKQKVSWFKSGGQGMMTHMMMNEVEAQFIEMAQGGDGSITMMGNIRERHYKGKSNLFFQQVCDAMGWKWRS